jgi:hypothetical protein
LRRCIAVAHYRCTEPHATTAIATRRRGAALSGGDTAVPQ